MYLAWEAVLPLQNVKVVKDLMHMYNIATWLFIHLEKFNRYLKFFFMAKKQKTQGFLCLFFFFFFFVFFFFCCQPWMHILVKEKKKNRKTQKKWLFSIVLDCTEAIVGYLSEALNVASILGFPRHKA